MQTKNGYRKYTAEQMAHALSESKGMIAPAARRLNTDRNTVKRYIREYASVRAAHEDAREDALDVAELALMRAVGQGEPWAVCFTLKTIGKGRGYVEHSEVSGPGGAPVTLKVVYDD